MRVSDRSLYISLGYILFSVPMLILEIFYSASQIRYNFFFYFVECSSFGCTKDKCCKLNHSLFLKNTILSFSKKSDIITRNTLEIVILLNALEVLFHDAY